MLLHASTHIPTPLEAKNVSTCHRLATITIKAFFIRRVSGAAEVVIDEEGKNKPKRFKKMFKGVPREV